MSDRTKVPGVVVDVVKLKRLIAAVEKEKAKTVRPAPSSPDSRS
jgi:hypothetical protein